MGLDINPHRGSDEMVTVSVKKWLTADRQELVDDGDPRAAVLYCTPGMQITRSEAERHGLVDSDDDQASDTDKESKARTEPPNKARNRQPANK